MSNIENIIEKLEYELIHNEEAYSQLSFIDYIKNYRTIGLILPRGAGITTAFKILSSCTSCIYFQKCFATYQRPNMFQYHSLPHLYDKQFRGNNYGGLKYSCFYLDNWSSVSQEEKNNLYDFIAKLKTDNVLSKDFYIITGG
jgi:hypothetical protein